MKNPTEPQTEARDYHVRCKGSAKLQIALQHEQAKILIETGKKMSLMDIAGMWLDEMATQKAA